MKRHVAPTRIQTPRAGFTLIELLVVITIIAILVAVFLPAIAGARYRAQVRAVATEIEQLDMAITSFKQKFGVEPPSSLTIPTSVAGWSAEDRQKITRIWGQFDFTTLGGLTGGYPSTAVHLNGAECLVFFLGGVNSNPTGDPTLIGFSKNPRTPWSGAGGNREVPFYDKFTGRLVDVDQDGAPEFVDSFPGQKTPFLYLSSQGKSYRKTNSTSALDDFDVHGGMNNSKDLSQLYLQADGKTPERSGGFQIISPGIDGTYGLGGLLTDKRTELTGTRAFEADNVTNFSGGLLQQ